DWEQEETFVSIDPLGNPVDRRHPWNQTTIPKPQKRDLEHGKYSWVMSPRWFDKRTGDYLALDTGGGAIARLWATARRAGGYGLREVDGTKRADDAAQERRVSGDDVRVEGPAVVECHRTRPRAHLLRGLCRGHRVLLPRQGV